MKINKIMKLSICILAFFLLSSCATTKVLNSWINEEYTAFKPKKILIIGLTENLSGRTLFESQLKYEFLKRGVEAVESYSVFKPTFTNLKQTESEIEAEVKRLSLEGFDAVLISAVKGVDDKVSYSGDEFRVYDYPSGFKRYYYLSQDVNFAKGYYNQYKIYHIETSLYNLKANNDKSLVWVASYDMVDPRKLNATVTNYVKAIIKSLKEHQLIADD
ncbi:MAG: hypothetical protein HKN40_07575 [Winogradskyella sp.]|uniref:hypothetical protein n=1 Tax=Winogradskyella sp. TaxID=1883156 RepID=UPI001839355F|nr:hypothetical protein [Winogradskyella sp.]